jgi:uncharacterized membrane protein YedE/YeeE
MKNSLISLVVGLIFAIGLGLSGMTQPAKVVGFLDIFGNWDPSLAFVMFGAIGVHSIVYRLVIHRPGPLASPKWHVPTRKDLNAPLFVGSALFGAGWGLAGYCPGPALVSSVSLMSDVLVFVVAMLAGMYVFKALAKPLKLS